MSPGDFVPLATIGTVMPNGMEISRRKLRGEWSNGMLCSGAEIEIGDDDDGILILGSDSKQGTPLADSLGIESDVLYDLEVNPNRPDAMSVIGVARDLAAYQKIPFKIPEPKVSEKGKNVSEILKAEIVSPDLCGRFVARVIEGVSIADSPQWLQNRITSLGMRPVNNVVDVSNYVMLEMGQPSHTFDLASVSNSEFKVRWASDGEEIVTLDGVSRKLTTEDGVVADGSNVPIWDRRCDGR
jgi:Phenylalanyl-tRNA synthetase beta subunit